MAGATDGHQTAPALITATDTIERANAAIGSRGTASSLQSSAEGTTMRHSPATWRS